MSLLIESDRPARNAHGREGRVKLAQKLGVAIAKLGSFAKSFARAVILQDQSPTGLGKAIALDAEAGEEIVPASRIGKIIGQKCAQRGNQTLIRPDRRLRFLAPMQVAVRASRMIWPIDASSASATASEGGKHGRGQAQGDVMGFHAAIVPLLG